MFKHILVPVDYSPRALKAARSVALIAKAGRARVTLLHVIPPFMPVVYDMEVLPYPDLYSPAEYRKRAERDAQALLARTAKAMAAAAPIRTAAVTATDEHPWRAIIKTARARKCDLIVMASHGRRGIAAVVLGSETTKVLTHSRLPVLVVR